MTFHFTTRDGSIFMDNRKISIKGINWFGLENPQYALHGLWSVNMEGVLD